MVLQFVDSWSGNIVSNIRNVYCLSFILLNPYFVAPATKWERLSNLFHVSLNCTISLGCLRNSCIEYAFLPR